ncbi:hypothetical protein A2482_04840 [Candidatus Falkowbacteria bacterium RIFOXYC2_FULL_48_21]|uniref:cysteine desulfurase n=1 Tax=Candidatus Falkowbacteria bacterium RIFOXYC2_FULL_48_21 TaxID=1798005 RepID=A0A1F5TEF5_9BACT|nr:MAG: hypothetical protein A2482_04840 [Candidatus Falkowbacteria bacterium RIFOXYC2_FULL_48_21]
MNNIYFDNSATTKIDPRVLEKMMPYLTEVFGNPGSIHSAGQAALSAVDEARAKVADFFHCAPAEVVFTSGATESNNLAIQGVVDFFVGQGKKIHIITSAIEHPSVLEVFKELQKMKKAEVDFIEVDQFGVLKLDQLKKKIKANTVLISLMYANNEVGSIQPISAVRDVILAERTKREAKALPLYFHIDAVQAANYLPCDVNGLGVDLMTISGHKIYAPKGVGALYLRKGVKVKPQGFGGHYEYGLRPGTLNVAGIVALGAAVDLIMQHGKTDIQKLKTIKEKLINEIDKVEDARFNGQIETQLPNIINVSFLNAEGESLLMMLDLEGIAISTGSACSSGSLEPSHVLTAMGIKPEWSHGSVRISLGRFNTSHEVAPFVGALRAAVDKLRKMAP